MKTAYVRQYGPPEVIELRDFPTPVPGPGEIRLKVLATAVTAGDFRVRSGKLPRGFGVLRGPVLGFGGPRKGVLGTDAAGVVDAVGEGVTRFQVGDAVIAFPGSAMGAHAEYLIMPAEGRVVAKPPSMSFEDAAALPFGAMTAIDFLHRGGLREGERVLVNGASGNVGSAAVQLAKHFGAHVTAVCSGRNAALVSSLGADEVIDYTQHDVTSSKSQFDVIVDCVGNLPYARAQPLLKSGGRLLLVLADLPATLGAIFAGRKHGHRVIAGPASEKVEDLVTVAELAEKGKLKPVIDERFSFDRIADAHRLVESGRKRGSAIVVIDSATH